MRTLSKPKHYNSLVTMRFGCMCNCRGCASVPANDYNNVDDASYQIYYRTSR